MSRFIFTRIYTPGFLRRNKHFFFIKKELLVFLSKKMPTFWTEKCGFCYRYCECQAKRSTKAAATPSHEISEIIIFLVEISKRRRCKSFTANRRILLLWWKRDNELNIKLQRFYWSPPPYPSQHKKGNPLYFSYSFSLLILLPEIISFVDWTQCHGTGSVGCALTKYNVIHDKRKAKYKKKKKTES